MGARNFHNKTAKTTVILKKKSHLTKKRIKGTNWTKTRESQTVMVSLFQKNMAHQLY